MFGEVNDGILLENVFCSFQHLKIELHCSINNSVILDASLQDISDPIFNRHIGINKCITSLFDKEQFKHLDSFDFGSWGGCRSSDGLVEILHVLFDLVVKGLLSEDLVEGRVFVEGREDVVELDEFRSG